MKIRVNFQVFSSAHISNCMVVLFDGKRWSVSRTFEPEVFNYLVLLVFNKHIITASKPMLITYVEDFAQKLSASLNPIHIQQIRTKTGHN